MCCSPRWHDRYVCDVWIACSLLEHPIPMRRGKWMMAICCITSNSKCMNCIYCNLTSISRQIQNVAYTYTKTSMNLWMFFSTLLVQARCPFIACCISPKADVSSASKGCNACEASQRQLQIPKYSRSWRKSCHFTAISNLVFYLWLLQNDGMLQRCTANTNYNCLTKPTMPKFIRLPGCFHLEVGFHSFLRTLDLHLILSELKDSWTSEHAVYLAHLISVSSFVSTPVQQSKTSQIFKTWSVAKKNSSKPCPSVSLLAAPNPTTQRRLFPEVVRSTKSCPRTISDSSFPPAGSDAFDKSCHAKWAVLSFHPLSFEALVARPQLYEQSAWFRTHRTGPNSNSKLGSKTILRLLCNGHTI